MIARLWPLPVLLALASCPPLPRTVRAAGEDAPDLETAALARGLVRDAAAVELAGLYSRENDRVCISRRGTGHRLSVLVDYGDSGSCRAAGRVSRTGDQLAVRLGDGCSFSAAFDGDRVSFPVRLPDACATSCSGRATMAALSAARLSEAPNVCE